MFELRPASELPVLQAQYISVTTLQPRRGYCSIVSLRVHNTYPSSGANARSLPPQKTFQPTWPRCPLLTLSQAPVYTYTSNFA